MKKFKKYSLYLLFFVLPFVVFMSNTKALSKDQVGYINAKGVLFYSEANFRGNKVLDTLDTGDQIKVVDPTLIASNDSNRCSNGFYKVSFYWESYNKKTYTGYVCANNINFSVDTSKYATEFSNASIPESYWEKLALLKDAHPKWKFTGYDTGLKWEDVIRAESVVGISYIQSNNPIYLSLDEGSYDPSTNTYYQKEAGGWYAANKQTVAYYMDPRNFLDEINIFMFENLGYNSTYQTKSVVNNIFKNTDLLQYSDYYISAATYGGNSISPISLAARSRQEVVIAGGKLSDSANGAKFKDKNVYNFYNIGAFSSCDNPILCGLEYAYNRNWTDPATAILEGAKIIASGYINEGQNTLYFQRWNVTRNNTYSHQYMTNIQAPITEGEATYNAYASIDGLFDNEIEFVIPIYNGMPSQASKLPTEVDNAKKEEINKNNTLGKVITGSGYIDRGEYITGIKVNTTASSVINSIKNNGGTASISANGKNISGSEKLATGNIINIKANNESKTYRIVIAGDVNGDSKISAVDYVFVKNYIMNSSSLEGANKIAADVNNDGKISAVDYVNIKNYIMGSNSTLR